MIKLERQMPKVYPIPLNNARFQVDERQKRHNRYVKANLPSNTKNIKKKEQPNTAVITQDTTSLDHGIFVPVPDSHHQ